MFEHFDYYILVFHAFRKEVGTCYCQTFQRVSSGDMPSISVGVSSLSERNDNPGFKVTDYSLVSATKISRDDHDTYIDMLKKQKGVENERGESALSN